MLARGVFLQRLDTLSNQFAVVEFGQLAHDFLEGWINLKVQDRLLRRRGRRCFRLACHAFYGTRFSQVCNPLKAS